MNFQEALKIVNKAIYEKEGRGLTDPEVVVLRGSWENLTYEEMAQKFPYTANYLKGDMGHKFWKLLSEALGESVSKRNFKAALERARTRFLVEDATPTQLKFPDYSQMQIKENKTKAVSVLELDESSKEVDSPRESSSTTEKRKVWQIVLELDKLDDIEPIIKQLEKLGEGSMTVKRIDKGSIVLTVETGSEFYERIKLLFDSEQLREVLGVKISYILPLPDELCLDFSPRELHAAWSLKSDYSNALARRNAYLNKLCFNKLATWLPGKVYKSQNRAILPGIWELVNGSAIQLGNRRLVLIPCEAADTDELRVPQEWIDIPSWIGNYYLAVQVSQDGWMRIWGYATHRQLKNEGIYDPNKRTYSLSGDRLGKLSQIWEVWILDTKVAVEPLPKLSGTERETLLQELSQPFVGSPPLQIPFEKWGALLEDENSREQLYRRRLSCGWVTSLSQWLENIFDIGWQTVEEILGPREFAVRKGPVSVERVKLLNLETAREQIALLVRVQPESETEMDIQVEVGLCDNQSYLPEMLAISVLDERQEVVMQGVARNCYKVQLDFSGEVGEGFSVKIALGEVSVIEKFVI